MIPSLTKLRNNWEGLAQSDPLWAICVDPTRRGRVWTEEELLATGETEIQTVLHYAQSQGLSLDTKGVALDFGCGVGRLTGALARRFHHCWGIDISPTMISLAQRLHCTQQHCTFWLNESETLSRFSDGYFAFIYTSITLQHIPRDLVFGYLGEFARTLRPDGALIFQLADFSKIGAIQHLRNLVGFRRHWKRFCNSSGG
jgi:ubiquinone/menaquinone biosynthesis C-methylase UbiE